MEKNQWLKNKDLTYKDGTLFFGDVSTTDLAEQFGTPLYVVNEDVIRNRYRTLFSAIKTQYDKFRIHYAVKANTSLAFLSIVNSEGAYFDVVSQGEIFLCKKAGIAPDKILFTGNNFTDEDLEYALKEGVMLNLDAISHIKRLASICENKEYKKPILSFRVNPEYGAGHHDHCITAGKDIKFGIFEPQVIEAYKIAIDSGFTHFGIQMHIGSGILNVEDFLKAIEMMFRIIKKVKEVHDIKFEFIDFGGGIGIPYRPEENPVNIEEYAKKVVGAFKNMINELDLKEPIFCIEPGRYISAESSILLTRVNTYKDTGFKIFIGVDAGFNTLIRPAFYGSYHQIEVCEPKDTNDEILADIVGQLCESGDVLARMRTIPKVYEGDLLAILDAGAYGYMMSSRYNSKPKPAEILIKRGNEPEIIRERETLEDLLFKQKVPSRLS